MSRLAPCYLLVVLCVHGVAMSRNTAPFRAMLRGVLHAFVLSFPNARDDGDAAASSTSHSHEHMQPFWRRRMPAVSPLSYIATEVLSNGVFSSRYTAARLSVDELPFKSARRLAPGNGMNVWKYSRRLANDKDLLRPHELGYADTHHEVVVQHVVDHNSGAVPCLSAVAVWP
jgi:hypothetical protein